MQSNEGKLTMKENYLCVCTFIKVRSNRVGFEELIRQMNKDHENHEGYFN